MRKRQKKKNVKKKAKNRQLVVDTILRVFSRGFWG